jgi:hypothetical protein
MKGHRQGNGKGFVKGGRASSPGKRRHIRKKIRALEEDLARNPPPEEPPAPATRFAGTWHWDSVRASIDACIAHLPPSPFRTALEQADSRRHDSSVVWKWGAALGHLLGLERPWEYGTALTNSSAIFRPSLETRERRAAGESTGWSSPEAERAWKCAVAKFQRGRDEESPEEVRTTSNNGSDNGHRGGRNAAE